MSTTPKPEELLAAVQHLHRPFWKQIDSQGGWYSTTEQRCVEDGKPWPCKTYTASTTSSGSGQHDSSTFPLSEGGRA